MDDLRLGSMIRTARLRKGWRQQDLALAGHVARATISRIERGHLGSLPLDTIRAICAGLDIRLELQPRWRGGDLDRMLSRRHSALHESVTRVLAVAFPEWEIAPEVSFSIYRERGVIDLLLWHPGRRALLLIELKTDIVDVGEMLGTLDKKRRLAWKIAEEKGWAPQTVSAWIVISGSRTNERRVSEFQAMLRSAYPADGRQIRAWLRDPQGSIAALSLWPAAATGGREVAPRRRMRKATASGTPAGARDARLRRVPAR
jgi:transcriptional regulator with XRE-family HTH domain